jgi:hypothetical protein
LEPEAIGWPTAGRTRKPSRYFSHKFPFKRDVFLLFDETLALRNLFAI